jgi:hypothetical protein
LRCAGAWAAAGWIAVGSVPALAAEPVARANSERGFARLWIGVAATVDFLAFANGQDVCALDEAGHPASPPSYYCTTATGADFPTRASPAENATLVPGQAGQTDAGMHVGDVRVLFALEYAITPALLVGARAGFVLNAYPPHGAAVGDGRAYALRLHAETRITYLAGDAPLSHVGLAPLVFAGVGLGEFDGHVTSVASTRAANGGGPVSQPVSVWRTGGPWFVTLGVGLRYQFSQRVAVSLSLRGNVAWNAADALPTLGPDVAVEYGF